MTESDIAALIRQTLGKTLSRARDADVARLIAQPDFAFDDVDADSIDIVEFCFQLEEALGVEIEVSDLSDHPTLKSFANYLSVYLESA